MTEQTTHWINGSWHAGQGAEFKSVDPARNEVIWSGKAASEIQVTLAVEAARQAFPEWSMKSFEKRLEIVRRFGELLSENKESLALAIAKDTGKPLWETRTEIAAMMGKIDISVKAYHERTGTVENEMPGAKAYIRHRPHGVVAVFGPYNFPGHLPNGHIIPALLAGNTVIFKPSEQTPLVAEETIKLWEKAGLPEGVLNLVQGLVATGKALASHSQVDGIFFTGSSTTGKLLHEQFGGQPGKILALEMGGNNPLIVRDVKDVDGAVYNIVQSAFISSGQRCTCARRLYLPNTDKGMQILKRLTEITKRISVGDYEEQPAHFMGAMISASAAKGMIKAQTKLIDLGAHPIVRMSQPDEDKGFVTPGIMDVSDIKHLPDEEYFGPLLQVKFYETFDEAIAAANNTRFGLSAGLLSDKRADYDYFLPRIRAGIVNWNKPITGASSAAPFGGIGDSGNHRASAYYAADYCAYPVASVESDKLELPSQRSPGLVFEK